MKIKSLFICVSFFSFYASAQQSLNMTLLSHWNDSTLNRCDQDQIWNDLTGWKDTVKNREYLIAGSCDSIYFFDITDPTKMVKVAVMAGKTGNCINRDYEMYSHYLYCVSDRCSPSIGALTIFEMKYLPDSVHIVYESDSLSTYSHTIFIETKTKKAYLCGNGYRPAGTRAMSILSIANPEHPVFLGEISSSSPCAYVHEVYVENDTAFCSCGYQGLYIYDVRDAANPKQISEILPGYPFSGYNHSGWIDSTHKYLMFTDEVPTGLPIKFYDISDIKNPTFISTINSHTSATPHNADWKGNIAWVSSYEDGVYAYDVRDPAHPKVAGFYDTYPKNDSGVYSSYYHGCWGVYCFLPSGNIIASDISEGLFVLKPSATMGIPDADDEHAVITAFPNPTSGTLHLTMTVLTEKLVSIIVTDVIGRSVIQKKVLLNNGVNELSFDQFKEFDGGCYFIEVITGSTKFTLKVMKE